MYTLQVSPPDLSGVKGIKLEGKSVGEAAQHGQSAPLALPDLGSGAFRGCTQRLWAARHSQRERLAHCPPPPPPRVLERAASTSPIPLRAATQVAKNAVFGFLDAAAANKSANKEKQAKRQALTLTLTLTLALP